MSVGFGRRPWANQPIYWRMRKGTFYTVLGLAGAGAFGYVASPYWQQEFDERNAPDAPDAPPLSVLTLVTSTGSDVHIAQNTISDEAIDVRAYHVISSPQIYRRWKLPDGE